MDRGHYPHEMVEELQTDFSAPNDDDYDGVDVTYINGATWAEETVQCRTPDNPTPVKLSRLPSMASLIRIALIRLACGG